MLKNVLQLPRLVITSTSTLSRSMSVFHPHFVDPVFKKQKQAEIFETGEASKMAHLPIKPMRNNDSASIFHDDRLSKFTNYVMQGGQKRLARTLIEKCFENIKRLQLEKYNKAATEEEKSKIETNPVKILHMAIDNCMPLLNVTPIKRGGVRYQVPVPITEKHSHFLACKWIVEAAREKERTIHLPEKLAYELLDAAGNQGRVVKRKQDLHRLCEANRAYSHYRWS